MVSGPLSGCRGAGPRDERPYVLVVAGYPAPDAQVPVLERYGLGGLAAFV